MPLLFSVLCLIMIWANYRITHKYINVISVLVLPYAILVPINNYVMTRYGFYKITDDVMLMLMGAFLCLFAGSILADIPYSRIHSLVKPVKMDGYNRKELKYKWKSMLVYTFVVDLVTLMRLLITILNHGTSYLGSEDFSGYLTSGILGHLLLSITPLIPVLFYYWLKNKRKYMYLFAAMVSLILFFFTFVKYHVIGIAIATYLFVSFEDSKYLRSGGIVLATVGVGAFVLNYLLSFVLRGVVSNVNSNYYFLHFWNYAAGSLIYDNRIFEQGIRVGTSIFYKLATFLSAPINLFTGALFNVRFFPHETQPHYLVASNGQIGNVVDAIGYLYPSKGNWAEIVLFALTMIAIGAVFTHIYNSNNDASNKNKTFATAMAYFLSYFVFLSFFGTFYINSVPYEILFWSWLMMKLFDKRVSIRIGQKKLL